MPGLSGAARGGFAERWFGAVPGAGERRRHEKGGVRVPGLGGPLEGFLKTH